MHNITSQARAYKRIPYIYTTLLALPLLGFGCSPTQMLQEKITEKVTETAVEGFVNSKLDGGKVDFSNNTVNVEDKNGNSIAYGENIKLPDHFPADIPIHPDIKLAMVSVARSESSSTSIIGTTTASKQALGDWLIAQTKQLGWTESQDDSYAGMWYRTYTKDSRQMTIGITGNEGETLSISIVVGNK